MSCCVPLPIRFPHQPQPRHLGNPTTPHNSPMKTSSLSVIFAACCILPASAFEPDVIIDANDHPSNVELFPAGSWANETTTTQAFRGASKVRNSAVSTDFARFHATLPSEGAWQVYLWQNSSSSGAGSVEISHAEGTTLVYHSHSSANSGQWMLLGTFWFDTESEAEVKIKGTASTLSADAIRFSLSTADTVLDTSLPAGVTFHPSSGAWTSIAGKFGNQQNLHRSNTNDATVTFAPTLTASGDYDVSVWLPPSAGTDWVPGGGTPSSSVQVEVHGRGGVVTTHTVALPNTGANEGQWVRVGSAPFRFHANGQPGQLNPHPAKVVVRVGSSGTWVPVDAVRFSKLGASEVFMDDADPTVTAEPTAWNPISGLSSAPFAGYRYLPFGTGYKSVYFASGSSSARSMTYRPSLAELGLYDVYILYPFYASSGGMSPSAGLTIQRTVDQRYGNGGWVHAGRFILNTSSDPTESARPWVRITTPVSPFTEGTYPFYSWLSSNQGNVVADAVLFLKDNENLDTDSDGVMDWFEFLVGSGSGVNDWDSDGIPDGDGDNDYLSLSVIYHPGGGPPVITVTNPIGAILF
jgi:hypothetical protein